MTGLNRDLLRPLHETVREAVLDAISSITSHEKLWLEIDRILQAEFDQAECSLMFEEDGSLEVLVTVGNSEAMFTGRPQWVIHDGVGDAEYQIAGIDRLVGALLAEKAKLQIEVKAK